MELEHAVQDLVAAAAALNGGSFENLGACQDALTTLWGVDVEFDELRTAVDAMEEAGSCSRAHGGFTLSTDALAELELRAADALEIERTAVEDWRVTLVVQNPEMTDDDFDVLREDLGVWLAAVVARHGVEAALILYPENERARQLFAEIDAAGLSVLPPRVGVVGKSATRHFNYLYDSLLKRSGPILRTTSIRLSVQLYFH